MELSYRNIVALTLNKSSEKFRSDKENRGHNYLGIGVRQKTCHLFAPRKFSKGK